MRSADPVPGIREGGRGARRASAAGLAVAPVMLGTNFAGWDQEDDIVRRVSGLELDSARREAVLGGTAVRWFGLHAAA